MPESGQFMNSMNFPRSYSAHYDQSSMMNYNQVYNQNSYYPMQKQYNDNIIPCEPLPYTFTSPLGSSLPSTYPFGTQSYAPNFPVFSPAPTPPAGTQLLINSAYQFPGPEEPAQQTEYISQSQSNFCQGNFYRRSASIPCMPSPLVYHVQPTIPSPTLIQQPMSPMTTPSPHLPSVYAGIPYAPPQSFSLGPTSQTLEVPIPPSDYTEYDPCDISGERRISCPISDMFLTDAIDLPDHSL